MQVIKRPHRAFIAVFGVIIAMVTFASPASAAPYTQQPTISVSDQTPRAGSRITVCGKDFHPRTRVEITLDERRLARVRTDRSGAFCKSVRLPSRAAGPQVITAEDRKGNSASVLINIEACRDDDDDDGDDNDRESRSNDRSGRGNDRDGRDDDHDGCDNDRDDRDGRGNDNGGRDVERIRSVGVSASSAIPAQTAVVSRSAENSELAVVGAAVIAMGALVGGGLVLLTGRRRKGRCLTDNR